MSQSAKPPRRAQKEAALLGIQPQDPFIQAHIREVNGTVGKHQTVVGQLRNDLALEFLPLAYELTCLLSVSKSLNCTCRSVVGNFKAIPENNSATRNSLDCSKTLGKC